MRYTTPITLISATFFSAIAAIAAIAAPSPANPSAEAFLPEQLFPELKAIIVSAEAHAPMLQMQSFYTEEANERYAQANSRRYPKVSLFANIGPRQEYRSGDAEDSSTFAANAGINLYQPLYHWGAIEAGIGQARLGSQAAEMDLMRQRNELIRNLRADYLNLQLTEQAQRNELERQVITDEKIKRAEIQHESGKINEIELRSIRLEKEQSLLNLERIDSQRELITQRFKKNYGWDKPLKINKSIPEIKTQQAMLWLKAEKENLNIATVYEFYPIQKQLNTLRQHEEQQTIINASNRPLINLFVSGMQGQTNTSNENDVDTLSVTAGINVSWNIFDGFLTTHKKIEANLKKRRLETQLEEGVQGLLIEQRRIINSLSLKFRELNLLEQQYQIEAEKYAEAEQSQEAGRMTKPQLQTSLIALNSLQQRVYQARADALMGASDYQTFTQLADSVD